METYKKIIIFSGIIWSLGWIYLIFTRYNKQSLFLWIAEFGSVFTIFILSEVLSRIKDNKYEIIRFLGIMFLLGLLFGIPVYVLSKNIFVLIYYGLSIAFNVINLYFLDIREKVNSFKTLTMNMIFLVLSGILGLGVLSIIIYHIFKIIEKTLKLFGIDLIKFEYKR